MPSLFLCVRPAGDALRALAASADVPPGDLHATMTFIGKTDRLPPGAARIAMDAAAAVAARHRAPWALVAGLGRFHQGAEDVVYARVASPTLPAIREELVAELERRGLAVDRTHGLTPHMTLGRVPSGAEWTRPVPFARERFGALWVCVGRESHAARWADDDGAEAPTRPNPGRSRPRIDLSHYGLDGFVAGEPTTLYHGTTASFRTFDLGMSRLDLVDEFYGPIIGLSPRRSVAAKYARANRNAGLPPSLVEDLRARNRPAGELLRALYERGPSEGWEAYARANGFWDDRPAPGEGLLDMVGLRRRVGVDPNLLADVVPYVIGAMEAPRRDDEPLDLFGGSTGAPHWLYDALDELGLDSSVYRPKVYTVTARARRVLVTDDKEAARAARSRGFDAVVYHGEDLVDGVPEVGVFDGDQAVVTAVEVLD